MTERVAGVDLLDNLLFFVRKRGSGHIFSARRVRRSKPVAVKFWISTPRFASLDLGTDILPQSRKPKSSKRSATAGRIACSLACRRLARSGFAQAHRDELNVPFIMGVGGSFDVLSGQIRRAPALVQALGLEWLYRVYQEPRRMWWRYARTNTLFAGMLARALIEHQDSAMFGQRAVSQFDPTEEARSMKKHFFVLW